jgi:outer membrane protein assembly factor BamE (lipoprotein component of BamABCDE complex)
MTRTVFGKAAIVALTMLVASCAPQDRFHGYAPDDAELADITVGRDTRESVAEAVGRPAAAGLMAESGWYYVRSRWEHTGGRAPKEVDRQVVAISFDTRGVVSNIERFGLEEGQVVPLSRRVTETNVRGMSFISRLLGALGNFDATRLLNRE